MLNYTIHDDAAAVASNNRFTRRDVMDMLRFAAGTMFLSMVMVVLVTLTELI